MGKTIPGLLRPFLLPLVLVLACTDGDPDQPGILAGTVAELHGELFQGSKALAVGDALAFTDEVELRSGWAVIDLGDGSSLRLFPKTTLRFRSKEKVLLSVGKLWARIVDLAAGEKFEVETSNAVAGVRGTDFIVEADEGAAGAPRARVTVVEGKVAVANRNSPKADVLVADGQVTVVEKDQPPTAPSRTPLNSHRQAWRSLTDGSTAKEGGEVGPEGTPQPDPGPGVSPVQRDDEAFEKLEKESAEKKKQLQREGERRRQKLKQEEEKVREGLKDPQAVEDDLRREMQKGIRGRKMKPGKRPSGRDSELEDMLK